MFSNTFRSRYYADVWIKPLEMIADLRVKRIVKAKVGTELGWAARGNDYGIKSPISTRFVAALISRN